MVLCANLPPSGVCAGNKSLAWQAGVLALPPSGVGAGHIPLAWQAGV